MSASLWIGWRDGVRASRGDRESIVVEGPGVGLTVRPGDAAVAAALARLAPPGSPEEDLIDSVLAAGGPGSLAIWYHSLERLARRGLVGRSVRTSDGPLVTLTPISASADPVPDRPYQLSRFAYLRRDGSSMMLESATSRARLIVHDPAAAGLIAGLAVPASPRELESRTPAIAPVAVSLILGLLVDGGFALPVDSGAEATAEAWEFHDLLFHARSRRGRTDAPYGATCRLAGRMPCPPPVRPVPDGPVTPLFRPDLARLEAQDPPLSRVVEQRRSERAYGDPPIDVQQLGEWFYRVARVRGEGAMVVDATTGPIRIATAPRPYPSGGNLYELEFYAAVAKCRGLEAGLYYYEPRGHALIRIRGVSPEVDGLLREAAESAGIDRGSLQILVIVSARMPRIAWKYESMAYALVLKHVGVVDHAMYLAATAMGLAACALGGGDSDLFARAAATDYYGETSVGECLLGSRPA